MSTPTRDVDAAFWWNGLREHKLLIQRCVSCATLRNPPKPMCPSCNSLQWDTIEACGRGTVYSYVKPRHPQIPLLDCPPIVVLVALAEGVRLVSNLCDIALRDVEVGLPVEVFYRPSTDGIVVHQFRPAPPLRA